MWYPLMDEGLNNRQGDESQSFQIQPDVGQFYLTRTGNTNIHAQMNLIASYPHCPISTPKDVELEKGFDPTQMLKNSHQHMLENIENVLFDDEEICHGNMPLQMKPLTHLYEEYDEVLNHFHKTPKLYGEETRNQEDMQDIKSKGKVIPSVEKQSTDIMIPLNYLKHQRKVKSKGCFDQSYSASSTGIKPAVYRILNTMPHDSIKKKKSVQGVTREFSPFRTNKHTKNNLKRKQGDQISQKTYPFGSPCDATQPSTSKHIKVQDMHGGNLHCETGVRSLCGPKRDQVETMRRVEDQELSAYTSSRPFYEMLNTMRYRGENNSRSCLRAIKAVLIQEGYLVLGKYPSISVNISRYFSGLFQDTLAKDPSIDHNSSRRKDLAHLHHVIRTELIKCFFGGLRVIYQEQGKEFLSEEVVKEGWDFLSQYFESLPSFSFRPKALSVNQTFNWENPEVILRYLESLEDLRNWSYKLTRILWHNFAKWNMSHQRVPSITYDSKSFVEKFELIESGRRAKNVLLQIHQHDTFGSTHLDDDTQDQEPFRDEASGTGDHDGLESTTIKRTFTMNKQNGRKLVNKRSSLGRQMVQYFKDLHQSLKEDSNVYIDKEELFRHKQLRILKSKNKVKQLESYNFQVLIQNAINIASKSITQAFLGTVEHFHKNSRLNSSKMRLLHHAFDFLKRFFSLWKDECTKGGYMDDVLLMMLQENTYVTDWNDPRASLYTCMMFSNIYKPPLLLLKYLSQCWLELILEDHLK